MRFDYMNVVHCHEALPCEDWIFSPEPFLRNRVVLLFIRPVADLLLPAGKSSFKNT